MATAFGVGLLSLTFSFAGCGSGDHKQSPSSQATASSHFEGGEKSIEEFGSEAEGPERKSILAIERSYLSAIAAGDFPAACTNLAANVLDSLRQVFGEGRGGVSCARRLAVLLSDAAPALANAQLRGRITKVRVEGDRAFVVFRAPGAELYQFTTVREAGRWKAASAGASVLVPSLSN